MLTRWNNFGWGEPDRHNHSMSDLRREMFRLFSDIDRGMGAVEEGGMFGSSVWPRVAVHDSGSEFVVRAEVPGMGEREIDVTLEQNTLTLKGERKVEVPEGFAVHRQERQNVSFARSFSLPAKVDAEKVEASLRNGVLELKLPKAAEEQPRQIQVNTSL